MPDKFFYRVSSPETKRQDFPTLNSEKKKIKKHGLGEVAFTSMYHRERKKNAVRV